MSEYGMTGYDRDGDGKIDSEPVYVVNPTGSIEEGYAPSGYDRDGDGKIDAKPVYIVNGSGGGTGGGGDFNPNNYYDKAQSDANDLFTAQGANGYTDVKLQNFYDKQQSDDNAQYYLQNANAYTDEQIEANKLVAGDNITIDENNIISATGGSSGVDVKLDIDSTKTKWIPLEKNLQLSNTDGSKITLPLDNLIDYGEFSTELGNKQNKLTAGTNITIDSSNVISATSGEASYIKGVTEFVSSIGGIQVDGWANKYLWNTRHNKYRYNSTSKQYNDNGPYATIIPANYYGFPTVSVFSYTLPEIPVNGGINLFQLDGTVVLADSNLPVVYSLTGVERLFRLPVNDARTNWELEINFEADLSGGTKDPNDVIRFELWNGNRRVKTRTIARTTVVEGENQSGGVSIPFFTNTMTDPMSITNGGFKLLIFNRFGVPIPAGSIVDFRIKRG